MVSEPGILSVSYAARVRVVGKYFGELLLMLSAMTLVPLAVSLYYGEYSTSYRYVMVVASLVAAGYALDRLPAPKRIRTNEALAVTCLAFVVTPMVMTFPLSAGGMGVLDTFFEAVSGVTTTGLSVAGSVTGKSHSFLFARAWLQWVGGLGIVVLSVALLVSPGMASRKLGFSETEMDDLAGGIKANARNITVVYIVITMAGFCALAIAGTGAFDAAVHTLAAVSTGGFSTYDDSLGGLATYAQRAVVIAITTAGAVSLVLYTRAYRKGVGELVNDVEFRALVAFGLAFTCIFGASLWLMDGYGPAEAAAKAPIMAMSAQTTAGFANMDVAGLSGISKFVLIAAMFVGGSVGSTAGGVKLLRLILIAKMVSMLILRTSVPASAVTGISVRGRAVGDEELRDCLLVVLLFVGVTALSWAAFLAYGYDPMDSLFDVVSATGTVGLSTGVTGPALPAPLKGVLCVDMIMGRVEFIALLVLVYPRTWFGKKGENV